MSAVRSRALVIALAAFVSCTTAYRPLDLRCRADRAAFEVCRDVLLARFGRLTVTDRQSFKLQTDWTPVEQGGRVVRRRATVFSNARGDIAVLVEESLLTASVLGEPRWTEPRGQASLELELGEAIETALGA